MAPAPIGKADATPVAAEPFAAARGVPLATPVTSAFVNKTRSARLAWAAGPDFTANIYVLRYVQSHIWVYIQYFHVFVETGAIMHTFLGIPLPALA